MKPRTRSIPNEQSECPNGTGLSDNATLRGARTAITSLGQWTGWLWLVASLAGAGVASGVPMGTNEAARAVQGWLKADAHPLGELMGARVQRVETFQDAAGEPLYHVVYLQPSGFAIVPADDGVEPVICFASRGTFDPSPKNPLGAMVSRDLPQRMQQARRPATKASGGKSNAQGRLAPAAKWQKLMATTANGSNANAMANDASAISSMRVAPLVSTDWSQSTAFDSTSIACYNYYTPPYGPGNTYNFVCGCVATAMAQLMYYWQYPGTGVGTGSYEIYVDDVGRIASLRGGDGNGGPYKWSSMPTLAPGSRNPTLAQCQAIGALTYDAGVAANMDYDEGNSGGSGTYIHNAKTALVNAFYYPNAVMGGYDDGSDNIGSNLSAMVNPNLDAHHPVLFGIANSTSRHAIVCDGYGYYFSTLYHHLNMGWSGMDNAWYALPYIDAESEQVVFTIIDSCIYNVFTNGTGEIISGRVISASGLPVGGATVTATQAGGGTYTATTDTNGIYALIELPSAADYSINVFKSGYVTATGDYSTGISMDYSMNTGNYWGADFVLATTSSPLVVNGGFEAGDFTGWTVTGDPAAVTDESGLVHAGVYGAMLGQVGFLGYLTQAVPTTAGSNYVVSLWLKNFGGSPNEFNVTWNGATVWDGANMAPCQWTNVQVLVAGASRSSTLQLGFRQDPSAFGLDDVTVTGTPEQASSVDHLVWSAIASPETVSNAFEVTVTAQSSSGGTATDFSGAASFSGAVSGWATNTLLGAVSVDGPWVGSYTDGYLFTPSENIQVTAIRYDEGSKVSIWTAEGTVVASQPVTSAPGMWLQTPLASPVTLMAGTQYIVGVYHGARVNYYEVPDAPLFFNDGTIDGGIYAVGDGFPTYPFSDLGAVDLVYTVETSISIPVSPSISGQFTNGVWSGKFCVQQGATNVILTASDGLGHGGNSGAFAVAAPMVLTVAASPSNGGSVGGGGSFPVGSQQQISAAPYSGWFFSQWQDGATANPRTVKVPAGGANYTACFMPVSAPGHFACCRTGNWQVALSFNGTTNYPYMLEVATNLAPPIHWQAVATNCADASGYWTWTVSNTTPLPRQFYRVQSQ